MTIHHKSAVIIQQQICVFNEQLELNFRTSPIESLLENRASFVDGVLTELWETSNCSNELLSLNAVGGYGRKTLHPHSDIDICILYDDELSQDDQANLQAFITQLWDLGLTLGHSVRSLADNETVCKKDVTAATNLLDIRHITGNSSHASQVKQAIFGNRLWSRERFFNAKVNEQKQRHKKHNHQSFKLEPNLKDGPGGMRDIQTLFWVSQKSLGGQSLKLLKQKGHLQADEYAELIEAQNFIWRVRWALHKVSGRDENRMLLEYQAEIAALLGFGDSSNFAIEKMMKQLFRASKRIKEINQMVLAFLKNEICSAGAVKIEPLNQNFELVNCRLSARFEDTFVYRKEILVMFRLIANTKTVIDELSPETIRLMRQARRCLLGDLQDFEECRNEFINILNGTAQLKNAITLMHHHGIFAAYLSQWREIVGQMQFDMFHAYTVDEHTFQTISNVIDLTDEKVSERFENLRPRFAKINQRLALLIAALFHDIAKGRGGDHSELGALDAKQFCLFHQLKQSDTKLIAWLVENHLLMSITSQRQDIHDPEVILNFAKKVGTQTKLESLYCLTVADINATNSNLWTSWKASLLEKLFLSTQKVLREGVENIFTIREKVKEHKVEALDELTSNTTLSNESIALLWKQLPLTFFSNSSPSEIIYFTNKLHARGKEQSFISIRENSIDGCTCVFAYMPDREGIFSDLFSTLSTLKVEVKDAQVTRTKDGFVLEVIKVLDFNRQTITSESRRKDIESRLQKVLLNKKAEGQPTVPKHLEPFENKIQVEYLNTRKKHRTLVSITALDNPCFMERICECFHSLNIKIHSAKISTIGEMVDNVFMVSGEDNNELGDKDKVELETSLRCQIKPETESHQQLQKPNFL